MPEGFAVAGVEGKEVAGRVAGEGEAGAGGEDAGAGAGADFVDPAHFAGLVVDGFDLAFAPDVVIGAGPAVSSRQRAWLRGSKRWRRAYN